MNVKLTNKNSELELTIDCINNNAYLDNTKVKALALLQFSWTLLVLLKTWYYFSSS